MSRCPTEGSKVAESQILPVLVLEGILKHLTVPKVTKEGLWTLQSFFETENITKTKKETFMKKAA